ncbi:unnamed protein product [Rotaria sp. Silwood2]|nr:unnamed protein product [Rotaria sp. Silwood2]CAF2668337.1 unnamed protein product [Rotaria sp. Silwood2]CAF2943986.1 unnamed protein product [Rotaria sp. Silwood2]CAF3193965.1 unnamed protein product [Rotaria sp. Silwood2]CAF3938554.1 unnamed protein product [Rotaria sp. Silwood2]
MTERKAFNIIQAVPVHDHEYDVERKIVCVAKSDNDEAKHSVTLNLTDLNSLRVPKTFAHGIGSITNDRDE